MSFSQERKQQSGLYAKSADINQQHFDLLHAVKTFDASSIWHTWL